ncbi:DUF2306 domain-containing protein [Terriglobus sp. ADX1]|uniref:DUF2306 domain-containing protein n=1 Tax=Terriglobus sp. ADX1 TaxID=2794063 RepID=UPI002FE56D00
MATLPASAPGTPARRLRPHHYLWIMLGLMGLSVLAYTDYPTFLGSDPLHARARFLKELVILIPHAIGGVTATVLGPFLFSTRFRQRHLMRHRVMGRVYVICIAIAAPTAYLLEPTIANCVGGLLWAACTFAAYQTARNRQIQAHRQWMVRSYLFTLNFIFTRVANPVPAWVHLSDERFFLILMGLFTAYLFFPDIYFNWRELTTSRKAAA